MTVWKALIWESRVRILGWKQTPPVYILHTTCASVGGWNLNAHGGPKREADRLPTVVPENCDFLRIFRLTFRPQSRRWSKREVFGCLWHFARCDGRHDHARALRSFLALHGVRRAKVYMDSDDGGGSSVLHPLNFGLHAAGRRAQTGRLAKSRGKGNGLRRSCHWWRWRISVMHRFSLWNSHQHRFPYFKSFFWSRCFCKLEQMAKFTTFLS